MSMITEVVLSREGWMALRSLCHEYLAKGGKLGGVKDEHVQEAYEALGDADRICLAPRTIEAEVQAEMDPST